jgi:hypothetical protein
MNTISGKSALTLLAIMLSSCAFAEQPVELGDNAALRYWAAFSEMQDAGISAQQAKELNSILEGTAPYKDASYRDLIERNALALNVMARGTKLASCDWGLDYELRDQTPVEYVRKSLELGRLNILYAFHLSINGDKDGSVRALAAGVRFSRDVAAGGSLFATLVAKDLLANHFRVIETLSHLGQQFSPSQRLQLQRAVTELGASSLDWQAAIRRELKALDRPDWQSSLRSINRNYAAALNDSSLLPALEQTIANAPPALRELIPNSRRVLEEKQNLDNQLQRIRLVLQ